MNRMLLSHLFVLSVIALCGFTVADDAADAADAANVGDTINAALGVKAYSNAATGCGTYYIIPVAVNWTTAELRCKQLGANLVKINSVYEQTLLQSWITSVPELVGNAFWIGLTKVGSVWRWTCDGSIVSYANWGAGQPDGDGTCGHIWGKFGYAWNDFYCYNTMVHGRPMYPLCEKCCCPKCC